MATLQIETEKPAHPLRRLDYLTLNAYWLALSYTSNSLGPIIFPTLVAALVPDYQKGSALGVLSSVGLIVALMVQPIAGAWTDKHTTRWGRRRPFIVGGTLLDVVFIVAIALSGNYVALLVAATLLQFSSNLAHGPYQGYIPELVPPSKRGAVIGVKQFLEIVGIILASQSTGYLVGHGQILAALGAIIFFLLFSMIVTAVFVSEQPFEGAPPVSPAKPELETRRAGGASDYLRALFHSRDFSLWLVSRLFILLGAGLVRNYALFFLHDVLELPNPASAVGSLLAVIAIAIAVVVYPAGILSDRLGRKPLVIASGLLGAAGALLLITATNLTQVLIYGGIVGVSIGIFLSVNWAWATDLIPAEGGGRFLGISNIATAGSGVLAAGGGFLLDYFNAQSHNLGYTALFLAAALCYALGTAIAFGVKDTGATRAPSTIVAVEEDALSN